MDRITFHFPSESSEPGHGVPSGNDPGQNRGNGMRPTNDVNVASESSWSNSLYTLLDNLYTRRAQLPGHDSSSFEPYRPAGGNQPPPRVRVGSKLCTVVRVIEPPTNEKGLMSDGVRILKDANGMLVVEKRLRMDDKHSKDRAGAEVRALEQIKNAGGSPYINRLLEALYTEGDSHSSLVLEYCDQGSLQDVIKDCRRRGEYISEQFCWHTFLQLSNALAMCHHGVRDPFNTDTRDLDWNTLCHIDIKPANVFLKTQRAPGFERVPWPTVVLGDFGCTVTKRDIKNGKFNANQIPYGTDGWFPPEANDSSLMERGMSRYGRHTDIWQLGGLIMVLCRKVEYPDMSLVASERPCGSRYSSTLNKAVKSCMAEKPSSRPTAIDVVRGVTESMKQGRE